MLSTLTLRQLKNALEEAQQEGFTLFNEAASSDQWAQIRKNEQYTAYWDSLEEQAARLLENPVFPPPFSDFILFGETGDRNVYEPKRHQLFASLYVFGMLGMIDQRPDWKKGLEDAIWSFCNEYTWVMPAHVGLYVNEYPNGIWDKPNAPRETIDLFAALDAFALAEILHLQGERLHPWVVGRAKTEIERRIFQVYFNDPVPQNWELKTNNWPATCASCIGAAAIYLTSDSEKLAGMLWRIIGVLRQYLSGFDEEGATPEGPAYGLGGFMPVVYFAELLKERTGGRITLLTDPKVEKIAQFPHFCILSNGKVVNFSDSPDVVRFNTGPICRLKNYFSSLRLPPEQNRINVIPPRWLDATRLMFWSLDQSGTEDLQEFDSQDRVQERYFSGNQWLISKVRKPDGRLAAFAAKGGYNEEPHNHNDLGHFILHVDGVTALADVGMGVYTKQYFQPEHRYETISAGSHGHSVPIVDGCRQSFGRNYRSELLKHEGTEDDVRFQLDLTKAYKCPSLKQLTREFLWHRPLNENPQLLITDKAAFHRMPSAFQEVLICNVEPKQVGPGRIAIGTVEMNYDSDEWYVEVEKKLTVAHPDIERMFYRLLLSRKEMSTAFECQFRFIITKQ